MINITILNSLFFIFLNFQKNYRDCMSGKGIDRHLFSLYIVCKGQGHVSSSSSLFGINFQFQRIQDSSFCCDVRFERVLTAGSETNSVFDAFYYYCVIQDSPFLKSALTMPWTLSTSQQPQQQMDRGLDISIPEVLETVCPFHLFANATKMTYSEG